MEKRKQLIFLFYIFLGHNFISLLVSSQDDLFLFIHIWIWFNLILLVKFYIIISENNKNNLIILFSVSALTVVIFLYLFQVYTGNIFEFINSGDSVMYYNQTQKIINKNFFDAISYFVNTTKYSYDDSGMIIYNWIVYNIYNDPFTLRLSNYIIFVFTSIIFFKTCKELKFKSEIKYFLTSLFSLSTFNLYFVSSGLKESIFLLIIICFWYLILKYKNEKSIFLYLQLILLCVSIGFFRIPIMLFFFLTLMYIQFKSSKYKYFILFPILISLFASSFFFIDIIQAYFFTQDQELTFKRGFIYNISLYLSAFFGPFPSYLTTIENRDTYLYSLGLFILTSIRLLSLSFIYRINFKDDIVQIIILNIVFHAIILVIVDRTFKIRFWMTAIPAIYFFFGFILNTIGTKKFDYIKLNFILFFALIWSFAWNYFRL